MKLFRFFFVLSFGLSLLSSPLPAAGEGNGGTLLEKIADAERARPFKGPVDQYDLYTPRPAPAVPAPAAAEPLQISPSDAIDSSFWFLLFSAVGIAAAGTLMFVVLLKKIVLNNPKLPVQSPPAVEPAMIPPPMQQAPVPFPQQQPMPAQIDPERIITSDASDDDDDVLIHLARQYRSGRGEMELAIKFAERNDGSEFTLEMPAQVKGKKVSRTDRTRLARKHRTGIGEIELAERLSMLAEGYHAHEVTV